MSRSRCFWCLLVLLCLACGQSRAEVNVLTGLDVLVEEDFAPLKGLRVGVITNQTGVDRQGRPVTGLLGGTDRLRLAAVFAPEHGLEGTLEGEYESAGLKGSKIPVYSLYGKVRKPRPEWLEGLDALVFDIQDIGTRYYTYITTLALCMQAAAEARVRFFVLDRPNPVGGLAVEGPVLEKSLCGNFIAYYPIPVRHGMTVGELAGLFNGEFGIGARLTVVRMRGYSRWMYYDDTGLAWINPSPNMRSLDAAVLYPGPGMAEATNLSVGRGTDLPFELYGAPYIDAARLAEKLNGYGLKGVIFRDTTFFPDSDKFKGQACHGVRALVTDRKGLPSLKAGLCLLSAVHSLHGQAFDLSRIDQWIGRREVKDQLRQGVPVDEIIRGWEAELKKFMSLREKYLLYQP